ncbi:MAG TPA: CPBP family intramembrane glutamic endopeptidase [Armatimonadota bacterium]|nr:CPBP family intramembrane glutamic endopeptidase [Armatimonadota bacterium]
MARVEGAEDGRRGITALEASLIALGAFFLCAWAVGSMGGRHSVVAWAAGTHLPPLVMLAGAVLIAARHRPILPPAWQGYSTPVFCAAAFMIGLAGGLGTPPTRAEALAPVLQPRVALMWAFLWVGVVAPIIEELFFRGILQVALRRHMPAIAAVGLSTLAFVLAHIGIGHFGLFLALGAFFGMMAALSGSVLPAIAAHIAWNVGTLWVGANPALMEAETDLLPILATPVFIAACALRWKEKKQK